MAIRSFFPALCLVSALACAVALAPVSARAQSMVPGLNNPLTDPGADKRKAEDLRRIQEFKTADTNHDDSLSAAEITAMRKRQFDAMDKDHDGFLDFSEFRLLRVDLPPDAKGEQFRALDKNGDGRLNLDEFTDLAGYMAADIDGNGALSSWEFRTR